jgi:hypothetical protein
MRKLIREVLFRLIKEDLVQIMETRKEQLIQIYREEMKKLDDRTHEENLFVDVKMVPLGEEILRASIDAFTRFLRET